jgi:hypothetical protein
MIRKTGLNVHSQQFDEYPQHVKDTYFKVSDLVRGLVEEFGNSVQIEVVDSASWKGIWMALKHRVKNTPAS